MYGGPIPLALMFGYLAASVAGAYTWQHMRAVSPAVRHVRTR
jgi:hypothetical protein